MAEKPVKRILRPATPEERERHSEIRTKVMEEFPRAAGVATPPPAPGIAARIYAARQAKGLTWYALAKLAGISNSGLIRDIEQGRDARISDLQAVAKALGLRLELVEEEV